MDEALVSYGKQEGGHRISSVGDVHPSFEDMQEKLYAQHRNLTGKI